MPMNLPPSGGLPSPMTQAPANAGAAAMPQGNAGNVHAAMVKVKNAAKMLEEALPLIPFGSEEHEKLAKIITELSKGIGKAGGGSNPQLEVGSLLQSAKNSAQSAPMAAMARMFAGQQGAGQPPAMPEPQAA